MEYISRYLAIYTLEELVGTFNYDSLNDGSGRLKMKPGPEYS